MTLFKVLAFFVIIAACFLFSPKLGTAPSAQPSLLSDPKLLFVAIALSMQSFLALIPAGMRRFTFQRRTPIPRKAFLVRYLPASLW